MPWSTWPITVMIGGRVSASSSSSSHRSSTCSTFWSSTSCSSPGSTRRMAAPTSAAKSSIWSSLIEWVAVTISPICMRKRTTSAAVRLNLGPSSCGVEERSTTISPSGTGVSCGVYVGRSIGWSSSRLRRRRPPLRRGGRCCGPRPPPGRPPGPPPGPPGPPGPPPGRAPKSTAGTTGTATAGTDHRRACRWADRRRDGREEAVWCDPSGPRGERTATTHAGRGRDRLAAAGAGRGRRDAPASQRCVAGRRLGGAALAAGASGWCAAARAGRAGAGCCSGRRRWAAGRGRGGGRAGGSGTGGGAGATGRADRSSSIRRGGAGRSLPLEVTTRAGAAGGADGPRGGGGLDGAPGRGLRGRRRAEPRRPGRRPPSSPSSRASGSSGWTSRTIPSRSALRRTRSACASSMLEECVLTPIPSVSQRSSVSLLVRPSSLASSCTRFLPAKFPGPTLRRVRDCAYLRAVHPRTNPGDRHDSDGIGGISGAEGPVPGPGAARRPPGTAPTRRTARPHGPPVYG